MTHVVVIGAGFAGLTAAVVLAARGLAVTVLEAAPHVGGRAQAHDAGGAHIDLGPTMLVDRRPWEDLAAATGTSLEETLALTRLDPGFTATVAGVRVAFRAGAADLAAEIARLGPDAADDWVRVTALGARAERVADHFNELGDVDGSRDLLRFVVGGRLAARDVLPFARCPSLAALLTAHVRTPALRALLGHFARFLGLSAAEAPSAALAIPHLMAVGGVWYPRGGFSRLARSLAVLAVRHGAVVETGVRVEGLAVERGHVRGARAASGRCYDADAVVVAADAATTAGWLGAPLAARVAHRRPSLAARVAWWVIEDEARRADHHAFYFDAPVGSEPLYVAVPTASDPTLAPAGIRIVYALAHGAAGEPASPDLARALRERLVAASAWPRGRVLIAGTAGGADACYGHAIRPGLLGSFRIPQRVRGIDNLVLAGDSVFPGPGVSNVVRSGLRAARLVEAAA